MLVICWKFLEHVLRCQVGKSAPPVLHHCIGHAVFVPLPHVICTNNPLKILFVQRLIWSCHLKQPQLKHAKTHIAQLPNIILPSSCHNMPQYATICHNMPQYATICHNMPQYATQHTQHSQHATTMNSNESNNCINHGDGMPHLQLGSNVLANQDIHRLCTGLCLGNG